MDFGTKSVRLYGFWYQIRQIIWLLVPNPSNYMAFGTKSVIYMVFGTKPSVSLLQEGQRQSPKLLLEETNKKAREALTSATRTPKGMRVKGLGVRV